MNELRHLVEMCLRVQSPHKNGRPLRSPERERGAITAIPWVEEAEEWKTDERKTVKVREACTLLQTAKKTAPIDEGTRD